MKKKNPMPIFFLMMIAIIIVIASGCKKNDTEEDPTVPVLTTSAVSNITTTTAKCGGSITSDGGASLTARGVCWSTSQLPSIANNKTTDGTDVGSFTSSVTGLTPGTTYYVRAYATNSAGTAYGNQVSFTTLSGGLQVGDNYQGGIIAYILQAGDPGYVAGETHGLIATPADQSAGVVWNNGSYTVTGATSDYDGKTNTNTIVGAQGAGNYAARICYDLVLGGYDDWYLPSKLELTTLYLNRAAIGGMTANYYWSSTEYAPSGAGNAWFYATFSGGYSHYGNKENTYSVRAIRSF
ncbi:MAG TPA: DUF1566 domain-containing protein [Bacteroidales bacterium]|nr:DUF1566 domain-containing protein [Bacteroidales bacterium]